MGAVAATGEREAARAGGSGRGFFAALALLCAAGAAATLAQGLSMRAMGGTPMPGGSQRFELRLVEVAVRLNRDREWVG